MNTAIIHYITTITIFPHWQRVSMYIDIFLKINSYEIDKNTCENTNLHKML